MDRFIFHDKQYEILDTVKGHQWVGIPLPFSECIFEFVDTGLEVSTAVCENGNSLAMGISQVSANNIRPLCSVDAELNNKRWPAHVRMAFLSGQEIPPECLYEFIRFYQRLSVYLAQPNKKRSIPCIEVRALKSDISCVDDTGQEKNSGVNTDRLISLAPLTEEELHYYTPKLESERKHQLHPCTYSFWVRGHHRKTKNGLHTWVEPYKKNVQFPEKSKIYALAREG